MLKMLQQIGLEDSEAKVYLALLELGPSSVSEITVKANITRTLGYYVLEKLSWYGMANKVSGKGSKAFFVAEHPRRVLQYVKNKINQWNRNYKLVENNLTDLVSLYSLNEKPIVKYKEGNNGIKKMANELLYAKTEILSILDLDYWNDKELHSFSIKWNKNRSDRRIKARQLILDTKLARKWMKYHKGSFQYTKIKWIDPEMMAGIENFGGELNICENKVMMALLKKPNRMGVMIQSFALASLLKGLFEMAWAMGKPFKISIKK